MFYQARITRENGNWSAGFLDCPGCQTQSDSEAELYASAKEAVEGWLETQLAFGDLPPSPRTHQEDGLLRVYIDPVLAVRIEIRLARHAAGWTQQDLAERAGVSRQQIAKLEHPDQNASLTTLAKVANALGMALDVRFEKVA